MNRRALTPAAAVAIKEMYAQLDSWGRPVNSMLSIAKHFGVGETTVYRVIHNYSAYMRTPEPVPEDEMNRRAAASIEKLREMGLIPEPGAPAVVPERRLPLDEGAAAKAKALMGDYNGK